MATKGLDLFAASFVNCGVARSSTYRQVRFRSATPCFRAIHRKSLRPEKKTLHFHLPSSIFPLAVSPCALHNFLAFSRLSYNNLLKLNHQYCWGGFVADSRQKISWVKNVPEGLPGLCVKKPFHV
jgi:hypothetical protein